MNYNNHDLNQHKKSDTVKWIIAFTLIAVLLFGVLASLYMSVDHTPKDKESDTVVEKFPKEEILAGGMQVGETEDYGISLAATEIEPESFSAYGVAEDAETAIILNATVLPADAVNKNVEWEVAWSDPTGTWATGKNVSDYVSFFSTGTKTTISCLQPFGEQITVTAKAAENNAIFALCTLEYAQKVTAAAVNIGAIDVNLGSFTDVKYEITPNIAGPGGIVEAEITKNTVYTVAENYQARVYFRRDPQKTSFEISGKHPSNMQVSDISITNWIGNRIGFDYGSDIFMWFFREDTGDVKIGNLTSEQLAGYFDNITSPYISTLYLEIKGEHNTYTFTSEILCTGYTCSTPVSQVTIDAENYVF